MKAYLNYRVLILDRIIVQIQNGSGLVSGANWRPSCPSWFSRWHLLALSIIFHNICHTIWILFYHCNWVSYDCSVIYCCWWVGVLRPFDTFYVISGAVSSKPSHTVPEQASEAIYQYLVPILSQVTDNCPSWISGRQRMVVETFSWPKLNEECFAGREARTRDRPHTRWTRIRSSYRARLTVH